MIAYYTYIGDSQNLNGLFHSATTIMMQHNIISEMSDEQHYVIERRHGLVVRYTINNGHEAIYLQITLWTMGGYFYVAKIEHERCVGITKMRPANDIIALPDIKSVSLWQLLQSLKPFKGMPWPQPHDSLAVTISNSYI